MIRLLRNREVRFHLLLLIALGGVGTILCALFGGPAAAVCAMLAAAAMLVCAALFTHARYRDIARLSDSLAKISAGDYSVDLRKYGEGELSILYDELHKVTRTLSNQKERLERDKRWLADTMADISHQLKTPLTSVAMLTDLLADTGLPPAKREEFLEGIRTGTERIRWLVLSLLKLSKLDAGAVEFQKKPVDARQLVSQALGPLRIPIELKGQLIILELEDAVIIGDAAWLTEAVGNLLKNCVEHTPAGGRIGVRCKDNPLYIAMEVWDDGPGIAPQDLPHIFERFYRGQGATPDSVGIGLSLSKIIITQHGGVIEAKSRPSEGARFLLKFYKSAV